MNKLIFSLLTLISISALCMEKKFEPLAHPSNMYAQMLTVCDTQCRRGLIDCFEVCMQPYSTLKTTWETCYKTSEVAQKNEECAAKCSSASLPMAWLTKKEKQLKYDCVLKCYDCVK